MQPFVEAGNDDDDDAKYVIFLTRMHLVVHRV